MTAGEHTIAREHLKGVLALVDSSGGARELGLTGLLERMYRRFIEALELDDPEIDLLCSIDTNARARRDAYVMGTRYQRHQYSSAPS